MPRPEVRAQAKEVLRMIGDFRSNREAFFSKGYLNSDGKRAFIRLLRTGLQLSFNLKGYALKRYRRGSEQDIESILTELESRLSAEKVTFKYHSKAKARTHE